MVVADVVNGISGEVVGGGFMAVVKVNGIERSYPEGTTYLEIARDFQDQYENDILLVRVNGKLRELEKTLAGDSEDFFYSQRRKCRL